MKFYKKSLIYNNNTTLYDIDFPQKIGFLRFFLRKFLLTVFHIFHGTYYFFYCPKFQKIEIFHKPQYIDIQQSELYDIDFNSKNWIFAIFFKKVSIDVFYIFHGTYYFFYCPKFQKWNFIKNPWYTKIQHCTTLIFLKKLDFCDFF